MQLTTEQIESEISALTSKLDGDKRPCRPADDHQGATETRLIMQDVPVVDDDGNPLYDEQTGEPKTERKVVGRSEELPGADVIREERRQWKERRRELRRELESRARQAEAATPARALSTIEGELATELALHRERKERLNQLARERDRAILQSELAGMPEGKKDALRQLLGPTGVPSGAKVGAPK